MLHGSTMPVTAGGVLGIPVDTRVLGGTATASKCSLALSHSVIVLVRANCAAARAYETPPTLRNPATLRSAATAWAVEGVTRPLPCSHRVRAKSAASAFGDQRGLLTRHA
jgi:hypothetical protein